MSDLFVLSGSYKHWQDNMNVIPLGNLSHRVKLLAQIVMNNLFLIDHHSGDGVARGHFIYALLMDVQIDFASIDIRLMKAMFIKSSVSLPYGSLISHIIARFIQIPAIEQTVKPLGPFSKGMVSRSKGQMQLRGNEDVAIPDVPADTTTSSPISLDDVMAKLNVMSSQMIGFTSIISGFQKDVKVLKTRLMGTSKVDSTVEEDRVKEHSPNDPPAQA
ncbi:hypothetical protein FH972_017528 [Carpinus fangiana]|uniref:Uncharacterized protein n=1 Tax=Carpinus fangiana TaxID=176857 RepID=A0A5N6RKJ3_9ROSI|nr:hypothetical protein FH972_017528 [Carpinus fangiana]